MECFQKVSDAIGPVYRRLTAQGGDGGSAYLDLEECCVGENNKNWRRVVKSLRMSSDQTFVSMQPSHVCGSVSPAQTFVHVQDAENPFNGGVKVGLMHQAVQRGN